MFDLSRLVDCMVIAAVPTIIAVVIHFTNRDRDPETSQPESKAAGFSLPSLYRQQGTRTEREDNYVPGLAIGCGAVAGVILFLLVYLLS